MKSASLFLVCCCLIASCLGKPPVFLGYQDSLGQYSFGYSAPGSARSEVRTSNGATRGIYSYVDETGVIQTAQYVADGENGFRVIATNLPQAPLPVQDTPEVMAARTAHLQALELASRRKEQENLENTQGKKIVMDHQQADDASVSQEQAQVKLAENAPKREESRASDNAENVEPKGGSDESPRTLDSRGGVGEKSQQNSQIIREESAGRATEEITGDANIPAIPLISSHVLLPQALGQRAVPVFRISHGNHEIQPSAIPEASIAQGASGVITPAGTAALKSGAISVKEAATPERKQTQRAGEQTETVNTLIAPLSIIPLSSSLSSFIGYVPPASFRYVAYNVL